MYVSFPCDDTFGYRLITVTPCRSIHEDPKELAPNNVADAAPGLRPLPPGLPAKPVSLAEVNKKKNYFPISWRVIGGGVLIGGPSALTRCSPKPPERLNLVPRPAESVSSLEQEEDPDQGEATTNKGIDISEGEDYRYLICPPFLSQ